MIKTKINIYAGTMLCLASVLFSCRSASTNSMAESTEMQWEKIGPGGGGAIFIPTFSYMSANKFLLRCDMTGSYLSRDGGKSYEQINFAGGASSFAWDYSDSNIVYIGSAGLNRSDDGGKSWKRIFPAPSDITGEQFKGDHADYSLETSESSLYNKQSGSISAIRPDPLKPGSVYFSMGDFFYYPDSASGSWKRASLDHPVNFIYTNKSSLPEKVYIFTELSFAVFDKKSGALEQKKIPAEMSPAFSFTAGTLTGTGKVIFYALHHDTSKEIRGEFGHSEVWMSEDLGDTWQNVKDPLVTNSEAGIKPSYSMIACAEFDAGKAYLITNRYEEKTGKEGFIYWYGAIKTGDAGRTWNWVWKGGGGSGQYGVRDGRGVSNLNDAWAEKAFGGEYIRLMDAGVDPENGNTAIVTDWYRTMKTADGGERWNEIYSAASTGGSFISRGLDVTTAYGIHFDPFDNKHIAISYTDIGYHHSFNGGKSWTRSVEGVPADWINTCYWLAFDPKIRDKVWSVWSGIHDLPRGKMTRNPEWSKRGRGGVCVSNDGGKTWRPEREGIGSDSPATCIIIDPLSDPGNRTLYATVYGKGVFKSIDDGKTWHQKNNGIEENKCAFELTLTGKRVLFLTVSATPAHKDGKKGREYYSGAVYRSADGAETWTKLKITDGPLFPNGIDYDRKNPDRIYLGCWADIDLSDLIGGDVARATGQNEIIPMPGGIFMSENGGETWKSIFDKKQYVYDVTCDPYHDGRLYCNTFNRAAYRSDDYGKSWKRIKGYDFHWGHRIIVDENDHEKVYITTFGSSVWHGVPVTESVKENPVQTRNPNGRNDMWDYTGAGGGGAMFNPAVSPHNPDYAYVACDMTGSYVTINGGKSWRMFSLHAPVRYFAFDPLDSNIVYAKSIALFKSSDRGNTWNIIYPAPSEIKGVIPKGDHAEERLITIDSTLRNVLAMAVDPASSHKLSAVIAINQSVGYYTSGDQGISWTREKELDKPIKNIFIDPKSPEDNRTIFLTGKNSITIREGGVWKTNNGPSGAGSLTEFAGGSDKSTGKFVIYAISGKSYFNSDGDVSGIFYTIDGGKTWENRQEGIVKLHKERNNPPEWRCIATSFNHPEVVYVSFNGLKISDDTTCLGVARSDDFGKTWKLVWKDRLTKGSATCSPNYEKGWIDDRFGPTWGENPFSIAVSAADPNVCYTTDFGRTIKTSDGGQSWEQLYSTQKKGGDWSSRGLEVTTGYTIVSDPFDTGHMFIASTDIGLMESHDGGESWRSGTMNNGIPRKWINSTYWVTFDPEVKGRIWAAMSDVHDLPRPKMWRRKGISGYEGGIVMSENSGKTWTPVSNDIGEAAVTHIFAERLPDEKSGTLYACAFGKGVFKSNDKGKTWIKKNNGIEGNEPFAWRLAGNGKNGELFLVVCRRSDDGSIGNDLDGALYRSSDRAESWSKMKLPEGTNGPMSIVVDPQNSDHLLLSAWGRTTPGRFSPDTGGGIFLSTDNGATWSHVLSKDQHIHDITVDTRNNTFYACGFNGSAYRSDDHGKSWQRIRGYNFKWGKRVDPDPMDPDKIYIITFGGGVWHGPATGDPNAREDITSPAILKE
jgi:photosystem II stability/assembly factor-like uncharacterized protein